MSSDTDVKCWVTSIGDLIKRRGGPGGSESLRLMIPPYQRPYAWKDENVNRLCKDIFSAISEGASDYHLGTLIFHPDELYGKSRWAVVDGQQRLRTISFILNESGLVESERELSESDNLMLKKILGHYENRMEEMREFLGKCTVVCILVTNIAEAFQLFDTQNGRGKELSPVNLLKAYHFHEMGRPGDIGHVPTDKRVRELELRWESSNNMRQYEGGRLLQHVFAEHLYRLRRWSRGQAFDVGFRREDIGEFKGLTIACFDDSLPLQNAAILRRLFREHYSNFGFSLDCVSGRLSRDRKDPQGMDPFMSISQPIINGEDFFNYAETYAVIYRELFPVTEDREGKRSVAASLLDPELIEFRKFHKEFCLYRGLKRVGDKYARHVFESLCVFCFDRFGSQVLNSYYQLLYRLAYYERTVNSRLHYQTAGSTFAVKSIQKMQTCETMSEMEDEMNILRNEIDKKCADYVAEHLKDGIFEYGVGWELVLGPQNVEVYNKMKVQGGQT